MRFYEALMCKSIPIVLSKDETFRTIEESELDSMNVPKRKLSLKWIQRSVDVFLGLPFNIASYGLLLHLLAKEVNMVPNELIFSGGDVHLYTNHIQQSKEQLTRQTFNLPKLELTNTSLDDLKYEDVKILNYQSDKVLKAELSN
jgi:thymidylate synthase